MKRSKKRAQQTDPATITTPTEIRTAELRSRVITFDYNGLGLSTGEKNYSPILLGQDAHDLIQALGLTELVIGGWSLGGLTAQPVVARYLQRAGHAVLIGTGPPGPLVKPVEQLL